MNESYGQESIKEGEDREEREKNEYSYVFISPTLKMNKNKALPRII